MGVWQEILETTKSSDFAAMCAKCLWITPTPKNEFSENRCIYGNDFCIFSKVLKQINTKTTEIYLYTL